MSRTHHQSTVAILRIEGLPPGSDKRQLEILCVKLRKAVAMQETDMETSDVHILMSIDHVCDCLAVTLERKSINLAAKHAETHKDRQHLIQPIIDLLRTYAEEHLPGRENITILPTIKPYEQLEHYSTHLSSR